MDLKTLKRIKIDILKEEARLLRLKKQGANVEQLIEKIKEIKTEILLLEAKAIRVSKMKTLATY